MAEDVYMDIPKVRDLSKKFGEIGQQLEQISKAMEMTIALLKTSAFMGNVGGAVQAQYLESVKPQVDGFGKKCAELGEDLEKSVKAYENGDALGATKFH